MCVPAISRSPDSHAYLKVSYHLSISNPSGLDSLKEQEENEWKGETQPNTVQSLTSGQVKSGGMQWDVYLPCLCTNMQNRLCFL